MPIWLIGVMSLLLWTVLGVMGYIVAAAFAGKGAQLKKYIIGMAIKLFLVDVVAFILVGRIYNQNMWADFVRFLMTTVGTLAVMILLRRYVDIIYEKLFFALAIIDMWRFLCCFVSGAIIWMITGNNTSINEFYNSVSLNWIRILLVAIIAVASHVPVRKFSKYIAGYKMRYPRIGKMLTVSYFMFVLLSNIAPNSYYGYVVMPEVMIGIIIIAIICNYAFHVENSEMSDMVEIMEYERGVMIEYCDMLDDQINQTKKLRHDLKNNAQVVLTLCEEENYEELKQYVREWKELMDSVKVKKYCDLQVINATLAQKEKICKEHNIKMDIDMSGIDKGDITDFDLTTLVFNLLDNSINGCKAVPENERYISFKCKNMYNQLIIIVKNSCNTDKPYRKKDDVGEHGHGIKIVNQIVKKYGGSINIEDQKNRYKVDINLNANPRS